jgi:ubiquinone/menaquinone biosynthesis C-methylase UbiE
MKLNLGCGNKKVKGFVNVDLYGSPDIKHDLNKAPYPFEDNSIEYVLCEHTLEHLKEPELFWREVHRILEKGGIAKVIVPHKDSVGAYCTFGHRGFYHEDAIDCVCYKGKGLDVSVQRGFNLIEKRVTRGRFKKWQKRDIIWVVSKI